MDIWKLLAFAVVTASFASAQAPLPGSRLHRIEAPVRDGGILHVASNTWTRRASSVGIGADVIYDNTVASGYFGSLSGDTYVDEGRIPSPTSPTGADSRPGCRTSYRIDGFQIAYCTDQASAGFEVAFFQSYAPCTTTIGLTPTASFLLTGLPGATPTVPAPCWTVTLDLDAPSSGPAFVMLADGDGTYVAPESANLFGWSFRSTAPVGQQLFTGLAIAGNPSVSSRYDGTVWDSPVDYSESGTGMGTLDRFRSEGQGTWPGCFFYNGVAYASFHLELYADACGTIPVGTEFCFGDGSGTSCPCWNTSPVPGTGCLNSLGVGARLRAQGISSISNDTVTLTGDQMPPNGSALFYQAMIQQNGGQGSIFGDGKRCAGGFVTRLGNTTNSAAGASSYPASGDSSISARGMIFSPGTRTYQVWYRNVASFCTGAPFNLSNGVEIQWGA